MSAGTFPQMSLAAYGDQFSSGRYMKIMIGLSLVLHLALLLFIAGLRLPNKMERPLAAYQVSLVTMPTPPSVEPKPVSQPVHPEPTKVTEPPKTPQPPVTRPTQQVVKETPPPPQPVRLAPTPHVRAPESIASKPIPTTPTPVSAPAPKIRQEAPPPASVPPPVMRQVETKPVQVPMPLPPRPVLNRDVLRGIAPPDVPKLGQVNSIPAGTPKETRSQTQADVQKILNNLTLPEPTAPSSSQPTTPPSARAVPPRPSMSEEVTRQLQKLEQVPPKVEPVKTPVAAEPQVASRTSTARTPVTTIQAVGEAQGNPYLTRVQRLISSQWTAPQVTLSGEQLRVLVRFRLDKNGKVSDLDVKSTSGNEYYDLAAKRAVLLANPLPSFPSEMTQQFLDVQFSFTVGEPVS